MSKMLHNYTAAVSIDATADYLLIDPASSGIYKSINRNVLLGLASAPLGTTDTQSPTNKTLDNTNTVTLKDTLFTLQDDGDTSKQAKFQLSGITTATTRTYTLPNASVTLASLTGTESLTNKTITSPTITGGTYDNGTITVDSISGHTSATIVTVGGLQISSGVLNTANAVTATSVATGAIQPQALITGTGSGWAWTTWSPSWVGASVGNGTIEAKYIQIGKTVFARVLFTLGTTSTVTGATTFTLPVTAATSAASVTDVLQLGSGTALIGGTLYGLIVGFATTTTAIVRTLNVAGTYPIQTDFTAAIPSAWANTSVMGVELFYEAA